VKIKAAVLVVSDSVSAGLKEDRSGRLAAEMLQPVADVAELCIVPDDIDRIRERLIAWCDAGMDVILTIGGTGLSPRDLTPEATRGIIERELPGISLALMMNGLASTPRAALSRAIAGQRGRTLIVNLPGNPSAVKDSIPVIIDLLPHALDMMSGKGHEQHESR